MKKSAEIENKICVFVNNVILIQETMFLTPCIYVARQKIFYLMLYQSWTECWPNGETHPHSCLGVSARSHLKQHRNE